MAAQKYINLMDYQLQAERVLPPAVWAYFKGGAGDEVTAQANIDEWQDILLAPRVLRNFKNANTHLKLLGKRCPCPIFAAPMAYQRMAHPDGEIALASACAVQGAGVTVSTQTSTPLQDIARVVLKEPDRGPLWFQLYLQHDRAFNLKLIRAVEAAGYEALVLTVDAPITGARDRERRSGFTLPPDISAVHLKDLPKLPKVQDPLTTVLNIMSLAPDWDSLRWLIDNSRLPVLVKGITHPKDALIAKKHKVQGIIVSNHGGRMLDTVAPTALLLPEIVSALKGSLPVLVDGGIRRGTDIIKALALGASAVMVGRPLIFALACEGAYGVAHAVNLLRDELEIAMALCGCKTIKEITADILLDR